jgi:hypothetical protein
MPPAPRAELDYRPSYLAAAIVSAVVFAVYLLTLAPSTAMWDTSEYIAAAHTLGLPHPPGNPFFVLVGKVFSLLPIAPSIAMRINMLAAICSAVSAGMWFLITERVLVSWLPERWQRIAGGALAALIGATAFTVWSQSVVNEKVYTVSLVGVAIIAWLTVRWCDDPHGPKADRILVLIAYLLGLGYSNHMAGFIAAPAVAIAVLARHPQVLLRWRLLVACIGALALGVTPFATQPIRAAYFPAINEGEPTGCTQQIGWDCTFSERTKDAFMYNFNRGQYDKPPLTQRMAPFDAQVGMWWLYFRWQWLRDADNEHPRLQAALAMLFLLLGLLGGYVHWRRDRRSFWFFGPLMLTMTLGLIYYLNFKYGYSQSPELGETVDREVRDRDYFYLWSFSAWSVWAALGLIFVWESVSALLGSQQVRLGSETVEQPHRRSWLLASPVLALAFIPLFANWRSASRAGETDTRDFAHDLLNSVEPYGILVTVGDNDTFPLWYAQEVEGIRRDVIVANTSLLNTDWYTRQLIRRPIYEYDSAKGPAIYRGKEWKKPTGPPLRMTMAEADQIPLVQSVERPMRFQKDSIVTTITPRNLFRADYAVLRMILEAFPERPVYFSRTSGNYGEELGLGNYLLTQGLARRLMPTIPGAGTKDTILLGGEGWVDIARTHALWKDVFAAPAELIDNGDWVDRPSAGIPYLYVATGIVLAEGLTRTGRGAEADSVMGVVEAVARATRLDGLLSMQQTNNTTPIQIPGMTDSPARIPVPIRR